MAHPWQKKQQKIYAGCICIVSMMYCVVSLLYLCRITTVVYRYCIDDVSMMYRCCIVAVSLPYYYDVVGGRIC